MNKDNATSFKSILVFFELLKKVHLKEVQYLEQLYLQSAVNFEHCLEFLLSINLISLNSGYIELTPQLDKFLFKQPQENEIKEFLLSKLLKKGNVYVWDYLERFSITNGKYIFEPQISENLRFSDLRNLLIELEFISYNPSEKYYEIIEKYAPLFVDIIKEHFISPEKLKIIIEEQEKIGKYAELEIMVYEKSRLSSQKDLLSKIEHTSLKDTSAGYDIKSFSVKDNSDVSERFIEVKAISSAEKKFFLTRNEIETSQKYGLNYYLYLLPLLEKYKFDITKLIIIQDPSNNIFNSSDWVVECEQFVIKKVEEE